MALRSYQDLIGWRKSIALVTEVYRCTESFPRPEMYGLTSQIRRAAISIPSNIAEGQGRRSRGEFKQSLGHARGSVFELESQIIIARNLGYLDEDQAKALLSQITELGRIINGLLNSLDRATNASTQN